ncbi:MAG TPA: dihydrofolate reductase family protein [Streptosporangiaceae bacterium]|nr:dihydrofolate reductase family protein [Streptosporangiaceae bacterium]
MRQIFPEQTELGDVAEAATGAGTAGREAMTSQLVARLGEIYAHPDGGSVRANMVASIDGAISLDGRSGGLSGAADRLVFTILRALADVIVVGAGTARAEHYGLAKPDWPQLREGRPPVAPIAIVTTQLDLDLDSPLIQGDKDHPRTIVFTTAQAPGDRVAKAAKTTDVISAEGNLVPGSGAIDKLAELGYRNILVEGGPMLLGELTAAGLVDDLCVTVSPLVAGGHSPRMVSGAGPVRPMRLASIIEDEGFLLSRYVRAGDGG